MAAQFVDALKGYEFFLAQRGKATRAEINLHLKANKRRKISQRTYEHYHNLITHGFRSYIPINQFDVFQALGRLQIAADRRRYEREEVSEPIQVSKDNKKWLKGEVINESPVGFGIKINGKLPLSKTSPFWIKKPEYKKIPGVVIWRRHEKNTTTLGFRAFEFVAKYRLVDKKISRQRLKGVLAIRRKTDKRLDWHDFFRVLEKANQLLKTSEDLFIAIANRSKRKVKPSDSQLSRIHFGSPGETQIKIDFGIAEIIKVIVEELKLRSDKKRRFTQETRKIELENDQLAIENFRRAIQLGGDLRKAGISDSMISKLLHGALQKALGVEALPSDLFAENSLERGILEEGVIPAAAELVAGDDPDFEININTSRRRQ